MMRNLDLLIDTITFPSRAFPRIYESTLWLFPLMLLVALSALANGAYFYFVDYNFMLDDMSGGIVDEDVLDDQAEMREAYRSIGRGSLVSVASLTAGLVSLGVAMLYSAYFSFLSLFRSQQIVYKAWLAFVAWCCMPGCLASLSMFLTCAMAPAGRIALEQANPLSTVSVLGPVVESDRMRQVLAGTDVTMVWSAVLMVLGYRMWTGTSYVAAVGTVLTPIALLSVFTLILAS